MKLQKRLAAKMVKVSKQRVKLNPAHPSKIKEAITRFDLRKLIRDKIITIAPLRGGSRARTRKVLEQKKKGRRRGLGSRKGKATARKPRKEVWIAKIRSQRKFLAHLKMKQLITIKDYHTLYKKAKGGFFRSTNHIKMYVNDHEMIVKK